MAFTAFQWMRHQFLALVRAPATLLLTIWLLGAIRTGVCLIRGFIATIRQSNIDLRALQLSPWPFFPYSITDFGGSSQVSASLRQFVNSTRINFLIEHQR
jgi:hypothetical protein